MHLYWGNPLLLFCLLSANLLETWNLYGLGILFLATPFFSFCILFLLLLVLLTHQSIQLKM